MTSKTDTFGELESHFRSYPASGKRSENEGVPSRVTLLHYAIESHYGEDLTGPIYSLTRTVLGSVLGALEGSHDPARVAEIVESAEDKESLVTAVETAINDRYPSAYDPAIGEDSELEVRGINSVDSAFLAVFAREGTDPETSAVESLNGDTVLVGEKSD